MRTTQDVIEAHLEYRLAGDLERDLAENYSPEVVLLSWGEGVRHGHDGVRFLAGVLGTYLPDGSYRYEDVVSDGRFGLLRWEGRGPRTEVRDGVDSFVVEDGVIVAQTIHYVAERDGG